MVQKSFQKNNYILAKVREEWFEGRIIDIKVEKNEMGENENHYKIYLLRLYNEIANCLPESSIYAATPENIKKFKVPALMRVTSKIHVPGSLLKLLHHDREFILDGRFVKFPVKIPVSKILNDFKNSMQLNKMSLFEDEIEELILGFFHVFESVVTLHLIYRNEKEYIGDVLLKNENQKMAYTFGPEHFLRMLYFLQAKLIDTIACVDTKELIYDYSVYLLDFLDLYSSKYFSVSNYQTT